MSYMKILSLAGKRGRERGIVTYIVWGSLHEKWAEFIYGPHLIPFNWNATVSFRINIVGSPGGVSVNSSICFRKTIKSPNFSFYCSWKKKNYVLQICYIVQLFVIRKICCIKDQKAHDLSSVGLKQGNKTCCDKCDIYCNKLILLNKLL